MFDSTRVTCRPTTKIKINAVSGTLVKNYSNSFILSFHVKSELGKELLCDRPKYYDHEHYRTRDVVILQTMLCGDNEVLAEVIFKDDFEGAQGKLEKGDM